MKNNKTLVISLAALGAVAIVAGITWWSLAHKRTVAVEFPMQVSTDIPTTVAAGPNGEVWFTIDFSDAIGRIRDGKLERIVKRGRNVEPIGLAVDKNGLAWYTDPSALAVSSVSADGKVTSVPLGTPIARLGRLAASPDGSIWFAEATSYSFTQLKDGKLRRNVIDSIRGGPYGVTVGTDGTMWGTLQSANQIMRVTPSGEMTQFELPTRAASPTDIAIDANGAVWVVEFRTNQITRFADGKFTEYGLPEGKSAPSGLAVAPDGSVWFGMMRGGGLGRLRDGKIKVYDLPRENSRPYSVTVDSKGNVWYADIGGFVGMLPADKVD